MATFFEYTLISIVVISFIGLLVAFANFFITYKKAPHDMKKQLLFGELANATRKEVFIFIFRYFLPPSITVLLFLSAFYIENIYGQIAIVWLMFFSALLTIRAWTTTH